MGIIGERDTRSHADLDRHGAWVLLRFSDRRADESLSMRLNPCAAGYFLGSTLVSRACSPVTASMVSRPWVRDAGRGAVLDRRLRRHWRARRYRYTRGAVGELSRRGPPTLPLLGAVLGQRPTMIAADLLLFAAASQWKLPLEESLSASVTPE
ncbi:MAG: hypothetical protein R3F18_14585 [Lysobacterales bacterium]